MRTIVDSNAALPDAPVANIAAVSEADAQDNKPPASPKTDTSVRTLSPARLTVGGKFRNFASESFSPQALLADAGAAGLTMASPPSAYPREWRQGAGSFGRNFGDYAVSWTAAQGGKFVAASVLHEDPRYYPSQRKNWLHRGAHAIGFAIVDRSDSGHARLAVSNFAGAFSGAFVGNAYLPDPYANRSHALARSGLGLAGFASNNLVEEFRPEIRKVAHAFHLPWFGN